MCGEGEGVVAVHYHKQRPNLELMSSIDHEQKQPEMCETSHYDQNLSAWCASLPKFNRLVAPTFKVRNSYSKLLTLEISELITRNHHKIKPYLRLDISKVHFRGYSVE